MKYVMLIVCMFLAGCMGSRVPEGYAELQYTSVLLRPFKAGEVYEYIWFNRPLEDMQGDNEYAMEKFARRVGDPRFITAIGKGRWQDHTDRYIYDTWSWEFYTIFNKDHPDYVKITSAEAIADLNKRLRRSIADANWYVHQWNPKAKGASDGEWLIRSSMLARNWFQAIGFPAISYMKFGGEKIIVDWLHDHGVEQTKDVNSLAVLNCILVSNAYLDFEVEEMSARFSERAAKKSTVTFESTVK